MNRVLHPENLLYMLFSEHAQIVNNVVDCLPFSASYALPSANQLLVSGSSNLRKRSSLNQILMRSLVPLSHSTVKVHVPYEFRAILFFHYHPEVDHQRKKDETSQKNSEEWQSRQNFISQEVPWIYNCLISYTNSETITRKQLKAIPPYFCGCLGTQNQDFIQKKIYHFLYS